MSVTQTLSGNVRDLGGFSVSRGLPQAALRNVGPFVFFDHLGPADFAAGNGIDLRPHPHIRLATVTYLFEGALTQRDSLGTIVDIASSAVNWMTAGSGITHSEQTPPDARAAGHRMHGIPSRVALPRDHAEDTPAFAHHPAETLPSINFGGAKRRLIAGSAFHATSPVAALSPMFYIDIDAEADASVALPGEYAERAIYIVSGAVDLAGIRYDAGQMVVVAPGGEVAWTAIEWTRAMLLGGAALDGPRHIEWNFVSDSLDRNEQAKADWRAGRLPRVPAETEFIPLPETPKVAEGSETS